ncbi:lasso peptide biosynthesis B2 protein [Leucobacter insecticola]|uniref:Lasso peptide biosynthesis B2 protein n=1 Tax=Leucobacter insecticola TaxID=2714934 RepID=A0A6G8FIY4_9MICO|nr:lasso peptide biosynthesis B2 protein [Leucobacter insecticola]
MSYEVTISQPKSPMSVLRRIKVRTAIGVAFLLCKLKPRRIIWFLKLLNTSRKPSSLDDAKQARAQVIALSVRCAHREGCVPRSIAVALLCRAEGGFADWCVGVRTTAPFGAHAWVEVNGHPVAEGIEPGQFAVLDSVRWKEE